MRLVAGPFQLLSRPLDKYLWNNCRKYNNNNNYQQWEKHIKFSTSMQQYWIFEFITIRQSQKVSTELPDDKKQQKDTKYQTR